MWLATRFSVGVTVFWLVSSLLKVSSIRVVEETVLGVDPQTVNRLNGESFQQDVLDTFNGMYINLILNPLLLCRGKFSLFRV